MAEQETRNNLLFIEVVHPLQYAAMRHENYWGGTSGDNSDGISPLDVR